MTAPTPGYVYRATIIRTVDGDTVHALLDLGCGVFTKKKLRLSGIDAPEQRTDAGKAATAALKARMPDGSAVVVATEKDPTDRYGRLLATIYADGESVNQWLLDNGHATPIAKA